MATLLELQAGSCGTAAALAERVGLRRTSMSMLLTRLQHEGWTQRSDHRYDGRRRCVRLTGSGRRRLDILRSGYYAIARAQVAALSPDERATLRRLLARIRSCSAPPPPRAWSELGYGLEDPFEEWAGHGEE